MMLASAQSDIISLFVEHPQAEQREISGKHRFFVIHHEMPEEFYVGNDLAQALKVLEAYTICQCLDGNCPFCIWNQPAEETQAV